jgi:hypothetical protein
MLCHKITEPGTYNSDTVFLTATLNRVFSNKNIVLCQIGANDGISADPIYDFIMQNENIEAHLVEPQKKAFQLLRNNYKNKPDGTVFF